MTTTTETHSNRFVRKIRVRAMLFFVLALAAGAGAAFLLKLYMDQARTASKAEPAPTRAVVVAADDVPIGTQLERRHLTLVQWPADHVPSGTFLAVEEVVGRSLEQTVVDGEPILAARLADPERGRGLAAILESGHRAMAVKVDQVIGIAGFVQPGDFVDVIATLKPDDETEAALHSKPARFAKIILQNIRVLAVGEHLSTDGHRPVTVSVVTLEVSPEQAERLALASQHGAIQLTMRSRTDQDNVETLGATPLVLLQGEDGEVARLPVVATNAPPTEAREPQHSRRRSTSSRRRHRPRPVPEVASAPQPPTVEILRGTEVEERVLRTSPDAQ